MRVPRSFLLLGAAALILALGLAALWPQRAVRRIYAVVPAALGVSEESPVLYRGVRVGRVARITFESAGVRLALDLIRDDVPLRARDTVRFSTLGLLGDRVIDVRPGPADAPPLPAGGTLRLVAPPSPEPDPSRLLEALIRSSRPLDTARRDSAGVTHR